MSSIVDVLENLGAKTFAAASPHIVITAPDGGQLWIPVALPATGGQSEGTSLWPRGFKISVALKPAPLDQPNVTDSAVEFLADHSLDLLSAWFVTPSPSALP